MLALHPLGTVSQRVWSVLGVYSAWACCLAVCLVNVWVWRSTLLLGYATNGFSPKLLPLFNIAITFGLALLFLILAILFEGLCRAWSEGRILASRLARVIGIGSLALGLGLSLLPL